ncbi:hypothetical protein B0H13DRAFT_2298498 [Mycena leptocephala]|nr:hypothetical protein B0H13DRAFT_2298498 [Mycena leptocephala]
MLYKFISSAILFLALTQGAIADSRVACGGLYDPPCPSNELCCGSLDGIGNFCQFGGLDCHGLNPPNEFHVQSVKGIEGNPVRFGFKIVNKRARTRLEGNEEVVWKEKKNDAAYHSLHRWPLKGPGGCGRAERRVDEGTAHGGEGVPADTTRQRGEAKIYGE